MTDCFKHIQHLIKADNEAWYMHNAHIVNERTTLYKWLDDNQHLTADNPTMANIPKGHVNRVIRIMKELMVIWEECEASNIKELM